MKTVVFCVPGRTFSTLFLSSWTDTILVCADLEILPVLSYAYCSNVYKVRNGCLKGRKDKGAAQKPFQGELAYDYLMWIDSDQVWAHEQFTQLFRYLEAHSDVGVLTGIYRQHENEPTYLVTQLGADRHATMQELEGRDEVIEIAGAGLGFCLMRYGVMEKLDYPWFRPVAMRFDDGFFDFTGEDSGFYYRARQAGIKIMADLGCRVGHEKPTVLL